MAVIMRKIITRLLLGLFVLITIGLAVRAIANYTTGRKLAAYLKEAKAAGIPMKVKALVPDCPDDANAAPLWRAAEALLPAGDKDMTLLGRAIDDLYNEKPFDEDTQRLLPELVARSRRALDLLAEASSKSCYRSYDWSKPAYKMSFTDGVKAIRALKLLAVEAVLLADAGDTQGALERCRVGLRFARLLLDEPFLIRGLIAMGSAKVTMITANRILAGREVDPKVLEEWVKELDPEAWRARFARVIPGERALGLESGLALVRGNAAPMEDSVSSISRNRIWIWLIRPALKSQILRFQRAYERLAKISGWPFYRQREGLAEIRAELKAGSLMARLLGSLYPDYEAPFLKEATLEAVILATRTGLACRLYMKNTGRFPENLEALVPEYLAAAPIDPFTGRPLVYRLSADGILIYSLGSNQKDDGGRMTYMITQLIEDKDDDWTWREKFLPATEPHLEEAP
jgi:hypothetical protein